MSDKEEIMRILMKNANKSFVKRILVPEDYPTLDIGNGNIATHKMAWGEIETKQGPKYVAFPTIMYDGKKLVDYGEKAFDKAIESGQFIEFNTPDEADWFTKKYKSVWDKEK